LQHWRRECGLKRTRGKGFQRVRTSATNIGLQKTGGLCRRTVFFQSDGDSDNNTCMSGRRRCLHSNIVYISYFIDPVHGDSVGCHTHNAVQR